MPVAANKMTAARSLAARVMRATGASASADDSGGSNGRTMDWSDVLDAYNRRENGMGDNPSPSVAGRIAPEAGRRTRQLRPVNNGFKPAVRIRLSPQAAEAIAKYLNTMRPGGTIPFSAEVATGTIRRILNYYHPEIQGLGNLGSWLSDALKGKGDNPLSKIVGIAAPIVGAVGGPVGAAVGAAAGGLISQGQQQAAAPSGPINPFTTLGPTLPGTPMAQPLTSQPQSSSPTVIVAPSDDEGWKKYIPLMVGGGIGLVVLAMVLKK